MRRDTLAETALRDAGSAVLNLRTTYSPNALRGIMWRAAELSLIARSEGTLTRAAAGDRLLKAVCALVTADSGW
jgi:hypothetical protein